MLRALYQLSTFSDERVRRRVNYAGLDVEELGSIYESLLEYHPVVRLEPPAFELAWGSERKKQGLTTLHQSWCGNLLRAPWCR